MSSSNRWVCGWICERAEGHELSQQSQGELFMEISLAFKFCDSDGVSIFEQPQVVEKKIDFP